MPQPRVSLVIAAAALVVGCATVSDREPLNSVERALDLPEGWQRLDAAGEIDPAWLGSFSDPALEAFTGRVLANNAELGAERQRLQQAREQLSVTRAARWPTFALSLATFRRDPEPIQFNDRFTLTLDVAWQADILGELSTANRAAALRLASAEARYLDVRRRIVADTARAWYGLAAARDLEGVFEQRVENATAALDVVERGYRSGINEALDVYLSRSAVEAEIAALAEQRQLAVEAAATLQALVVDYPDGDLAETPSLAIPPVTPAAGVPGALITRRADLQQSWLDLLAADADAAVAHKQRFPRLVFTGDAQGVGPTVGEAIDTDPLNWRIFTSLTQPLFEGGRLRAAERSALARAAELEQVWLGNVVGAFAEVENGLSRSRTLDQRFAATNQSRIAADAALELALDQYARGIINFATVLETQQRAFDARAAEVRLAEARLRNRIDLYQALGGPFGPTDTMEARR